MDLLELPSAAGGFLAATNHVVLAYLLALNSFHALLLVLSVPELWSYRHLADDEHLTRMLGSEALPPLSVMVPAHDDEVSIVGSVLGLLALEYPRHEVVLVNDGSTDATMTRLIEAYDLYQVPPAFMVSLPTQPVRAYYRSRRYSKLLVVDKERGGRADALNAALNAARYPYVLAVDVDTLVEPDALLRLARPILLGESVAAVGAALRVANSRRIESGRMVDACVDRRLLPGLQTVEYLRAFLFGRLGWNRLGGNPVVSRTFGLLRRDLVQSVGGYRTGIVTEDVDLVVRLHRHVRERKLRVTLPFIPDPVAWTQVPADLRTLGQQRERWHRGLIATLWTHREMMLNPRHGRVGLLSFPFLLFGEMLAPAIELLGYVALVLGLAFGTVDGEFALLFLAVAVGFGTLLNVWALVLEELGFRRHRRPGDVAALFAFALLESLGYRQLTAWFRLRAFRRLSSGVRGRSARRREGFGDADETAVVGPGTRAA